MTNLTIGDLLYNLGLEKPYYYNKEEDNYIVKLDNSNEFYKAYILLDGADWIHMEEGDFSLKETKTILVYETDNNKFRITLEADFDSDNYLLKIEV